MNRSRREGTLGVLRKPPVDELKKMPQKKLEPSSPDRKQVGNEGVLPVTPREQTYQEIV